MFEDASFKLAAALLRSLCNCLQSKNSEVYNETEIECIYYMAIILGK